MSSRHSLVLSAFGALSLLILGGCATDQASNIPGNAIVASSGDDRLSYSTSTSGTVWVYDETNDRIDYSGPVAMNDSISVDPGAKAVLINGRVVMDKLDRSAKHKIYFLAGQQTQ